jgi:uncharacterized protein (DUF427 family)
MADTALPVQRDPHRLQVLFEGHLIADSARALAVAGQGNVRYFPSEDVATAFLAPSGRREPAGEVGEAVYYTLSRDGRVCEDAAWSYAEPTGPFEPLAGHLAFSPSEFQLHDMGVQPEPPSEARPGREAIIDVEQDARHDIARPYRDTGAL